MFPRLDDWYKLPVTAVEIADLTKKDKVLVKVYEHTSSGSPNHCPDPEIKPHWNRREDLYLEDGCLLCRRVVIPLKLQGHLLDELHECRPGMCRIKIPARSFVCWPGIDQDIEDRARVCEDCVNAQSIPKSASLLYWPWATAPWQRIHVDFASSPPTNLQAMVWRREVCGHSKVCIKLMEIQGLCNVEWLTFFCDTGARELNAEKRIILKNKLWRKIPPPCRKRFL